MTMTMTNWYLIHCKPRQEKRALQNLEQQGYTCYLPLLPEEILHRDGLAVVDEPLFPRYLFIRLDRSDSSMSWSPIRSTKGVSRLVSFGTEPARIDDRLIDKLRARESIERLQPRRLFEPGDRVRLTDGPFAGLEGIYQMPDGESRVMVLIEFLSKPAQMRVAPAKLLKVG